jgi:hypothetical protein
MKSAQEVTELCDAQTCLAQYRTESSALYGAVLWDDDNAPVVMPIDSVAALRADMGEARRFQNTNNLTERQVG